MRSFASQDLDLVPWFKSSATYSASYAAAVCAAVLAAILRIRAAKSRLVEPPFERGRHALLVLLEAQEAVFDLRQ